MAWLVSSTGREEADQRYARWLASAGIALEWSGEGAQCTHLTGGLLLTGGGDVDPAHYGEQCHPRASGVDRGRDEREMELVHQALRAGRPIIGICRGLQLLNVALGGGLFQDVSEHVPGEQHEQVEGRDSWHGLVLRGPGALSRGLAGVVEVNSSHHQAVDPARLGRGLTVAAVSPGGVIEAVAGLDGAAPVFGVQWHPERLPPGHPASRELLQWMKEMI